LAWELLAKTNPNKPHVNMLQFIGELKDIPSLVQDEGRRVLRQIAKGYISWRWAIKPMINDVLGLCSFGEAVNKRLAQLNRLKDGKGLRKRVSLGHDSQETVTGPWPLDSLTQGSRLMVKERITASYKMWGVANYKLADGAVLPEKGSPEMFNLARDLCQGLNSAGALSAAWELLPWSWFVDWFSHIGDVIDATNNTVPLTWGNLSVMRTSKTVKVLEPTLVPADITISKNLPNTWTRKERHSVFPLLPFSPSLPLFDSGKWSILSALAVLRYSSQDPYRIRSQRRYDFFGLQRRLGWSIR
jgi:hypothetical protein